MEEAWDSPESDLTTLRGQLKPSLPVTQVSGEKAGPRAFSLLLALPLTGQGLAAPET